MNSRTNSRRSLWKHWGRLSFDKYGNLCIQKFISKIPASDLVLHAGELASKLTQLATHRFANHVLQAYVDQAVRHSSRHTVNVIVSAMKQSFFELATDQFGSFVVCTALAAFEDEASTPWLTIVCKGQTFAKIARTQYTAASCCKSGSTWLVKCSCVESPCSLQKACFAAVSA